jgi:hypothetical protein
MLGGPQSRYVGGGKEKNSHPLPRLELLIIPTSQLFEQVVSGRKFKSKSFTNEFQGCAMVKLA